jgi:large subunit ribosomal protein L3
VRFLKRPAVNTSQLPEGRRVGALAMKVGMLAIWDKWGQRYPTTVLQLDNCEVVQTKTEETNGYTALQLGVGEAKPSRVKKPQAGHFAKAGVSPKRKLQEFCVTPDAVLPAGTKIEAMHFVPGQLVDVCGISKGKGFQGVMKRWNFGGGRATHGNSLSHRIIGSTGCRQDPGKVFKNKKMPGRMGSERITTQNLTVLKVSTLKFSFVGIFFFFFFFSLSPSFSLSLSLSLCRLILLDNFSSSKVQSLVTMATLFVLLMLSKVHTIQLHLHFQLSWLMRTLIEANKSSRQSLRAMWVSSRNLMIHIKPVA